mmetsp:Transcript_38050/g.94562  ORF Transcript_38050/g.94562 Transcript_38050/m.94562 type:complete len:80 (+) Transcript_38050:119-358(+)
MEAFHPLLRSESLRFCLEAASLVAASLLPVLPEVTFTEAGHVQVEEERSAGRKVEVPLPFQTMARTAVELPIQRHPRQR